MAAGVARAIFSCQLTCNAGRAAIFRSPARYILPITRALANTSPRQPRAGYLNIEEAAMVMDDTIGIGPDENAFLRSETYWLERVPPELEWDESEAALLVEDIVGGPRVRGFN
jgi:hypothetical protein